MLESLLILLVLDFPDELFEPDQISLNLLPRVPFHLVVFDIGDIVRISIVKALLGQLGLVCEVDGFRPFRCSADGLMSLSQCQSLGERSIFTFSVLGGVLGGLLLGWLLALLIQGVQFLLLFQLLLLLL